MHVRLDIADTVIQATIFFATQWLFHIHQDQTDRKRSYWSNDSRWDPLSVWHKARWRMQKKMAIIALNQKITDEI
jgi:hypothetical protein